MNSYIACKGGFTWKSLLNTLVVCSSKSRHGNTELRAINLSKMEVLTKNDTSRAVLGVSGIMC